MVYLVIGGLTGLIAAAVVGVVTYRYALRSRASLASRIEQAEYELTHDIQRIGTDELQRTTPGRELLINLSLSDEETLEKILILKEEIQLLIGLRRGDTEVVRKLLVLREQLEWLLEQHPVMDTGMLRQMKVSQKVHFLLQGRLTDHRISPSEKDELKKRIEDSGAELERVQRDLLAQGK